METIPNPLVGKIVESVTSDYPEEQSVNYNMYATGNKDIEISKKDHDNLSYIKLFGIGISEEGKLATTEYEVEVRRLINSIKPVEVDVDREFISDGNKIVMYLLDGNRTEFTSNGQCQVRIAQIINNGSHEIIVEQPELRALLDNLSVSHNIIIGL